MGAIWQGIFDSAIAVAGDVFTDMTGIVAVLVGIVIAFLVVSKLLAIAKRGR